MKLVFAGTPGAAVPSLRVLLDSGHDVAAVVTRPDATAGRGRKVAASPVAEVAAEAGVRVLKPEKADDPVFLDELRAIAPDCCPVVAYGALLRQDALDVPPKGWVNLHFSLLPAWRGAAPVQHAVLHGDDVTGAATFQIEAGLDSGPVFGMLTEPIGPHDTSGDLLERLSRSGADLLARTLDGIDAGTLAARPQESDGMSYAPKLTPADSEVDFHTPAMRVDRLVRACTPAPGAWTTFRGARVKLGPVVPAPEAPALPPGRLSVAKHEVLVGTATTPVRLGAVQPQGKRSMDAPEWARGVRPGDDERLGGD
ncbi:methionyl-tRNA formyltransferase [Murinocardiopsis flavida]|uniref:Methionyl-tRNA formyltransferase n=1 Tax=Murinocardiopsis flavida TaxID=645275 RepID=A0A2P8DI10_9ACTN|nr:methionyl-tRNA formyltransferase [Murinocardiopsis flavida]PSK96846.1 methionyl-tRNA formyltransferase [Murinocardiopsis flavida]